MLSSEFLDTEAEVEYWRRQYDEAKTNLTRLNAAKIAEAVALLKQGMRQLDVIRKTKLTQPVVSRIVKRLRAKGDLGQTQDNKAA